MALPIPGTLSPSKLSSFIDCAMQFRFSSIEGLPEPPTVATSRGTLVHAALERLFSHPPTERTRDQAARCVDEAFAEYRTHPEWTGLGLDPGAEATVLSEAHVLVERYFELEDPTAVQPVGVELQLSAEIDGVVLRGIIDRLDMTPEGLVVTDYKTGRSPTEATARARMLGVHVYSLLVERNFGRRPVRVQLLHLAEPECIVAAPTEQSTRGLERKVAAVWAAVEQACATDDFRPRPSPRCDWCAFRQWCPAFGGDPDRARVDLDIAARSAAGQDPLLLM